MSHFKSVERRSTSEPMKFPKLMNENSITFEQVDSGVQFTAASPIFNVVGLKLLPAGIGQSR